MAFLDRLLTGLGFKSASISSSLDLFREVYGATASRSGTTVDWARALEVATVLACCRVVAEGVSQVPWRVYQNVNGSRKVATDHPLYQRIYRRPNSWQTSFEFRETIVFHMMLTSNAFVFVNRVGIAREVRELIPIEPGRVTVEQLPDYRLQYRVRGRDGGSQVFPADAIWHLRGASWNSWLGMDAMKLARESIGLTMALEQSQAALSKNGGRVGGLVSIEGNLTDEKYHQLRAWIDTNYGGAENVGKWMIMDRSSKFTPMVMTGVDAQHLETRKFQIEEICREFRVMPIMVGHADKTATYASSEQMFLAHVVHTLLPWYQRLEMSGDVNLLSESDIAAGYYTKFSPNALMRGAAADRSEFYAKALGSGGGKGWMTQNEVRDAEEIDRSDEPEADQLPQPATSAMPAADAGGADDPKDIGDK
jgi:HK97 family phage portal protein